LRLEPGSPYLDASALVKLVVTEPESEALLVELGRWAERITSSISITEVIRACRLAGSAALLDQAHAVVAATAMLDTDIPLLRDAAGLDPVELRSLDAIHLAAALSLGGDLGIVFTYDKRLAAAARGHKLEVVSPT
jgi:predicted nucleic acid-binding protein